MTPFDADALRVMLQAFYPIVSAGALRRAKRDRPEYFAAGTLVGSKGDKLQLPDGRIFDCIAGASGPNPTWWVGDVTNAPAAPPELWPLEDGPLVPLDEEALGEVVPRSTFEDLATSAYQELVGADEAIGTHAATLTASADSAAVLDGFDQALRDAGGGLADDVGRVGAIDPAAILVAHDDAGHTVTGAEIDWDTLEPGSLPSLPNPPGPGPAPTPDPDADPAPRAPRAPGDGDKDPGHQGDSGGG